MGDAFRHSLAFRLALQYSLVFALGAAALFGVVYWRLADALEEREREAVERRLESLAGAYERGGVPGLRAELARETSPEVRSFFVRVLGPGNETVFASVPPDWIETQIQRFPLPDAWGGVVAVREVRTVRVPQSASRDYAIAYRELEDGRLLQAGRSTDSRAVLLAPVRRVLAGAGSVALGLSIAAASLLAWRATRPLRAVSRTARQIVETGNLAARVPEVRGAGELTALATQINTLLERNAAHVRILRETLDNLAHDLRTPLTRLRGTAELALLGRAGPGEAQEALADCVNETDRVLHLLETLLDVSAAEAGVLALRRERLDVRELVTRAVDLYREVAEEKRIAVGWEAPAEPVPCDGDAVRLGQAVGNLLDNALKYTPLDGRVTLELASGDGAVELRVSDTGPGVPEAEREAVFRRLYRGDASRSQRGLGLGLSLVRGIVEAHGGSVKVEDAEAGGACFVVRLPEDRPSSSV